MIASAQYKFTHVMRERGQCLMFWVEFVRPGCKGCWTGHAATPNGVRWQAQNRQLLLGQGAEVLLLADGLHFMYHGLDHYFDQKGRGFRPAIDKGRLGSTATEVAK